jgi:isopenicillin-N epimerase
MSDIARRGAMSLLASAITAGLVAPRLRLDAQEIAGSGGGPRDEEFWSRVRAAFDLPQGITNLDNAAYGPPPREVIDDLIRDLRSVEALPSPRLGELYREKTAKVMVPRLAALLGVPADEIALVRNATEALHTVVQGVPLKRGDEVVCSAHDFWTVLDALEQRRVRDGITIRQITPPIPAPSAVELARLYAAAITPGTRLVVVTHASNVTGQLYPVRLIADAAHRVGAEVLVDAAQTLALLPHTIPDLDCDYYAASLHKWLLAPIGSGVIWVRKPLADKVPSLFPSWPGSVGVLRYAGFGTYPEPLASAAAGALEFHQKIGAVRKAERLRYLLSYWRGRVESLPRVKFYTSSAPEASCGLAVFEIAGIDAGALKKHLWDAHRIVVRAMQDEARVPDIRGIRVTANIYTSLPDLDRFITAIERVIQVGL